jgi:hypothetical protein
VDTSRVRTSKWTQNHGENQLYLAGWPLQAMHGENRCRVDHGLTMAAAGLFPLLEFCRNSTNTRTGRCRARWYTACTGLCSRIHATVAIQHVLVKMEDDYRLSSSAQIKQFISMHVDPCASACGFVHTLLRGRTRHKQPANSSTSHTATPAK